MKIIFSFILLAISTMNPTQAFAYLDELDGLLKDYVKPVSANNIQYNGVDYLSWGKDPRHAKVIEEILSTQPNSLSSKNDKLAFWMNAYNVLTIDLISREGETESIKNLGSTFTSPWKAHDWSISGQKYTLDNIEHNIIRKLGEPRIHFAINCAAKSCPDLRNEAYRASRLESQLEDQTQKTLGNRTKGYRVESNNTIRVSKVMDWFKEDFNGGDLRSWLKSYRPEDINDSTSIKFLDYDWSLNKQ